MSKRWKDSHPERIRAGNWITDILRRLTKQNAETPLRPGIYKAMKILANLGDKCATCSGAGPFDVDHIVALRRAPELAFEPSNLQHLCAPCHKAKTKSER